MEQNVPRRLARFNRNQNSPQQQNYSYNQPQDQSNQNRSNRNKNDQEENFQVGTDRIPSMDYNDVNLEADKKNLEELRTLQEKNLVEKLALGEIERFKVQNNRMPNSKEEEQIAETLYNQLRTDSTNNQNNNSTQQPTQRGRNRKERNAETSNMGQGVNQPLQQAPINTQPTMQNSNSQVTDIKDLFGEDEKDTQSKGKQKDDFDISLGDISESDSTKSEGTDEISQIEDISDEEKSLCPNCKKNTEKVIYCSKCGTAFCVNCAKTQGTDKLCPKCGTKAKI